MCIFLFSVLLLTLLIGIPDSSEARVFWSDISTTPSSGGQYHEMMLQGFRFYAGGRAIVNITNYESIEGKFALRGYEDEVIVISVNVTGQDENVTGPVGFEFEFTDENAGFYDLIFKPFKRRMRDKYFNLYFNFTSSPGNYMSAGEENLPFVYFLLIGILICGIIAWVYKLSQKILKKSTRHYLIILLVLIKIVHLFSECSFINRKMSFGAEYYVLCGLKIVIEWFWPFILVQWKVCEPAKWKLHALWVGRY
eukprot:TRINITY_DN9469_c0_g1_i1.p1 TRINITY_DN9469_c0_g1~~TRINITY_DN9469_c0_g1_i1.p1  ORF type:complete len:252 (+),score=27.05 TRINITY_DN9469_c0_g1_i1:117-872(+)